MKTASQLTGDDYRDPGVIGRGLTEEVVGGAAIAMSMSDRAMPIV